MQNYSKFSGAHQFAGLMWKNKQNIITKHLTAGHIGF